MSGGGRLSFPPWVSFGFATAREYGEWVDKQTYKTRCRIAWGRIKIKRTGYMQEYLDFLERENHD